MATPMRQLMQRRPIISSRIFEGVLRRQVDAVLGAAVECAVRLVVGDVRAGVVQNLLARLDSLESRVLFRCVWRDALDLLSVEDGVDAVDEFGFLGVLVVASFGAPVSPVVPV